MEEEKKTVRDIVVGFLEASGFDGLCNPSICGCLLEDLMPCCEGVESCVPGYKGPCTCGEGCDFDIYETKEAVEAARKDKEEGAKDENYPDDALFS